MLTAVLVLSREGAGFVELGRKDLEGLKEPDPRKVSEKQCEIRVTTSIVRHTCLMDLTHRSTLR